MIGLIPWIKSTAKRGGRFLVRNGPTILTGLSVGGTVTAVTFAVKDTPKAMALIEKRKKELGVDKLEPVEMIKTCWPVYIPTVGMTLVSVGCGIGGHAILAGRLKDMTGRAASLAGLYATSERTLQEYREQVVDKIGKEEENDIHRKAVEEAEKPAEERKLIPKGDELFYDDYAKRWFRSDWHTIMSWELDIREQMSTGMQFYMSAIDAYAMIDQVPPESDEDKGWNIDDHFRIGHEECRADNGERYTKIWFTTPPHKRYEKMY